MKAWRLHQPGGPDAFVLEDIPRPEPAPGRVLIEIRAFTWGFDLLPVAHQAMDENRANGKMVVVVC